MNNTYHESTTDCILTWEAQRRYKTLADSHVSSIETNLLQHGVVVKQAVSTKKTKVVTDPYKWMLPTYPLIRHWRTTAGQDKAAAIS